MRLWNWRRPKVYRRRILFEQLEERIVLSAAVTPQPTNVLLDHPHHAHNALTDHHDSHTTATTHPLVAPPPPAPTTAAQVFHHDLHEVLVSNALDKIPHVSLATPQWENAISHNTHHDNLVMIGHELQGVSKASGQKIDNLAIIGHGAENAMRIGTNRIDFSNVGQFSSELTSLGQALNDHTQTQLFGGALAKDAHEKAHVGSISKLSHTDVFAGDDNTGGAKGNGAHDHSSHTDVAIKPGPSQTRDNVHVLVVSSSIQDANQLLNAAAPGVLTVEYSPATDTPDTILLKIETALSGHKADSIAFATYDQTPGQFYLTDSYLVNPSTLLGSVELQSFWKGVGSLVNHNGRIDLLACSLDANSTGNLLLSELDSLTGRNFAASADPTGNPQYGGNWVLESDGVNIAPIYFSQTALDHFSGLLDNQLTVTAPTALTTAEGASVLLTGSNAIVILDAENDPVIVTVTAGHGTLTAGTQTGSSITLTGLASDVTVELAGPNYTPTVNYHGSDSISVNVTETSAGHLTASSNVGVTVTNGVHVLVVSSAIQDSAQLVNAAAPGVLTVTYNPTTDSPDSILTKIETTLHGVKADSIAFATDDYSPGQFYLTGNYLVNPSTLLSSTELQHFWKGVASVVNANGRIDLLECNLVANQTGYTLLSELESLTGLQFAASSDPTGNPQQGGDWVLESSGINIAPIYFSEALSQFSGLLGTPPVLSLDGTLDTTFGTNHTGIVTTNFNNSNSEATAVAVQPDGKIVVVGSTDSGAGIAIDRYLRNGTIDPSFGTNGEVTINVGTNATGANAVAIQPDGKIVVGGWLNWDFGLVRLYSNGTIDPSFGTNGQERVTSFGTDSVVKSLCLQADGKIVAVGVENGLPVVARFTSSGILDTSSNDLTSPFNGSLGYVALSSYPNGYPSWNSVAINPSNNDIVVAGLGAATGYAQFLVGSYLSNGTPDPSFGTNGIVSTPVGLYTSGANSLAIEANGTIVVAGNALDVANSAYSNFALAVYDSYGVLKNSFNSTGSLPGTLQTDFFGNQDSAYSVGVEADGKIVVAGNAYKPGWYIALVRYNNDGTLDTGFYNTSSANLTPGEVFYSSYGGGPVAMAIQTDGNIVAASTDSNSPWDFLVLRYDGASTTPYYKNSEMV